MAKCKCVFAIPLMGLPEWCRVITVSCFCAIFCLLCYYRDNGFFGCCYNLCAKHDQLPKMKSSYGNVAGLTMR